MNLIHLAEKSYAAKLPNLSPCCSTTTFYRLPHLRTEYEANEAAKIKSIMDSKTQEFDRPPNSSTEFASASAKKLKADSFTALAEDVLYNTRGPTQDPQKTSDRTCLRRFAVTTLETHPPKRAEELLQKALAELDRLAHDPEVRRPMALFMHKVRNGEFAD